MRLEKILETPHDAVQINSIIKYSLQNDQEAESITHYDNFNKKRNNITLMNVGFI